MNSILLQLQQVLDETEAADAEMGVRCGRYDALVKEMCALFVYSCSPAVARFM
jgi:hypothetical protein